MSNYLQSGTVDDFLNYYCSYSFTADDLLKAIGDDSCGLRWAVVKRVDFTVIKENTTNRKTVRVNCNGLVIREDY